MKGFSLGIFWRNLWIEHALDLLERTTHIKITFTFSLDLGKKTHTYAGVYCSEKIPIINVHKFINVLSFSPRCWSFVGMIKGRQPISLNKYGCLYTSVVQHEILHALGFHHEHSRSDRDQYILIKSENIRRGRLIALVFLVQMSVFFLSRYC